MHAIGQGFESPHLQKDESVGVSGTSPDERARGCGPRTGTLKFFDRIRKKQRRRVAGFLRRRFRDDRGPEGGSGNANNEEEKSSSERL